MKKILIAGGSRGIGKTIATAFLKNGDKVFLVARNAAELEGAEKELSSLGEVRTVTADVSKEDDVAKVAAAIDSAWGGVDVLVNAAGIYGPIGSVTEVDPAKWRQAIDVNLIGTFLMIRAIAPLMKKQKSGTIINFAGGGEGAFSNFTAYVSSKGGVVRLNETVAAELK